MQLLKQLSQGLSHLFYPRLCYGCTKPLLPQEKILCIGCDSEISRTGYHNTTGNETEMRLAGRLPFLHATSFAYFITDGLLQHLMHGLKYKSRKDIGNFLGKQLAYELQHTDWVKDIDYIVPVPLHPKKKALRGYNQAAVIGAGMSEVLGIPLNEEILIRTRFTESQTQKTREERVNNMQQVFTVKNTERHSGKTFLLIDDVLTTGATLEACALELLTIKDVKVCIATIGIAQ